MKKLFYFLFCIALTSCTSFNFFDYDNALQLKGKPKKVKISTFHARESFGEFEKGALDNVGVVEYNECGQITSDVMYDSDGNAFLTITKKYNEKAQLTQHNYSFKSNYYSYSYNNDYEYLEVSDNQIIRNNHYTDSDGKEINRIDTLVFDKKALEVSIYSNYHVRQKLNKNFKIIEWGYLENGQYTPYQAMEYGKDGNVTSIHQFDTETKSITYKYTQYDEKGNWLERVKVQGKDKYIESAEYTY